MYFAGESWSVGKTYSAAALSLTVAAVLGVDVNLLGGSEVQSRYSYQHMRRMWDYDGAPKYMLETDTVTKMGLTNKATIKPLTASQKVVRGDHPAFLFLDELDEMLWDIFQSAIGQPMAQTNCYGVELGPYPVTGTSTLQYADGTMQKVINYLNDKGHPLYRWCMRCTSNPIDGWLTQEQIEHKRQTVSEERWRVEYCVSASERVITPKGAVRLGDIAAGDAVLTRAGFQEVLIVHQRGLRPTLEVLFEDGSFSCTPDHRVLTAEGWVRADSLAEGQNLLLAEPLAGQRSEPLAHNLSQAVALTALPVSLSLASLAGQVSMDTPSSSVLSRQLGGEGDIFSKAHQFQVGRIDTQVLAANMIDGQASGNGSEINEPADPVGVGFATYETSPGIPSAGPGAVLGSTASLTGGGTLPEPALSEGLDYELLPGFDVNLDSKVVKGFVLPRRTHLDGQMGAVAFPATSSAGVSQWSEAVGAKTSRVVSVSHASIVPTMDLTVSGMSEYVLDSGAVMHNCLGEPSIGNRAILSAAVENMFDLPRPDADDTVKIVGNTYEEYFFESHSPVEDYVIAADWGRAVDYTVITVWKVTQVPIKLVYYLRMKKVDWPQQIKKFDRLKKQYRAEGIHDATGLGSVVASMLEGMDDIWDFQMTGSKRDDMLSEFILGVERGHLKAPRIESFYKALLFASEEDVFTKRATIGGEQKGRRHLPDEFCSAALAWRLVSDRYEGSSPVSFEREAHKGIESREYPKTHWEKEPPKTRSLEDIDRLLGALPLDHMSEDDAGYGYMNLI